MPFTYLGLPLGTTRPMVRDLMPLVDRIERRLTGTAIWLSYGEWVQLIISALSSLLSFAMCVLKLPPKLIGIFDRSATLAALCPALLAAASMTSPAVDFTSAIWSPFLLPPVFCASFLIFFFFDGTSFLIQVKFSSLRSLFYFPLLLITSS